MKTDTNSKTSSLQHLPIRVIGPGTLVAVVVVLFLLTRQGFLSEKSPIHPHPASNHPPDTVSKRLTLDFLLQEALHLNLSKEQRSTITQTLHQREREIAPAEADAKKAAESFSQFMSSHAAGGLSIQQIQTAAEPAAAASLKSRLLAQKFDEQALRLLNPHQQSLALQLWENSRTSRGRKQMPGDRHTVPEGQL